MSVSQQTIKPEYCKENAVGNAKVISEQLEVKSLIKSTNHFLSNVVLLLHTRIINKYELISCVLCNIGVCVSPSPFRS